MFPSDSSSVVPGSLPGGGAGGADAVPSLSYLENLPNEVLVKSIFPYLDTAYLMQLRQVSKRFAILIDKNILLNCWYYLEGNVDYRVLPKTIKTITTNIPGGAGILSHLSELKTGEVVIALCFADNRAVCNMSTGNVLWENARVVSREFQHVSFAGRFKIIGENHSFVDGSDNYVGISDTSSALPNRTINLKGTYKVNMLSSGLHLVVSYDDTIDVIDCITAQVLGTLNIKHSCIQPLLDGRVGVGSEDGYIRIFNAGKLENQWQGHSGKVVALQLLSDCRLVSASQNDSQIELATWEFIDKCG